MAEAPPKFAEGKCFGHYFLSLNNIYILYILSLWHSLPSAAAIGVSPRKSVYVGKHRHEGNGKLEKCNMTDDAPHAGGGKAELTEDALEAAALAVGHFELVHRLVVKGLDIFHSAIVS